MKNKLQNEINSDALLREVVEEVKNEELQQLWNKYGLFVIVGVAIILTITISFESIKAWKEKNDQKLSDAYSVAMSLQSQGRLDESLSIYQSLIEKNTGIYDELSKLQTANIYFGQNKNSEAAETLQKMIDDKDTLPQMKFVAAIKLAAYKLDTDAPAEEVNALLQPLLQDKNSSVVARELSAMLNIREKNFVQAKSEYEKILSSPEISDEIRARASDMINLLDEKK